ncbi:hypothetical protein I547_0107 [Mycobacterium kansasii 824]|nr:hypothetical protein I547_0107 [Mycobacterium kansasii 824]
MVTGSRSIPGRDLDSGRSQTLARSHPSGELTHIAIQEMVDGRFVDWLEKVSDEQYLS